MFVIMIGHQEPQMGRNAEEGNQNQE